MQFLAVSSIFTHLSFTSAKFSLLKLCAVWYLLEVHIIVKKFHHYHNVLCQAVSYVILYNP